MATNSSILAWEIPQTEKSSGLQSIRLQSQTRLSNWTPTPSQGKQGLWCCNMKQSLMADASNRSDGDMKGRPQTPRSLPVLFIELMECASDAIWFERQWFVLFHLLILCWQHTPSVMPNYCSPELCRKICGSKSCPRHPERIWAFGIDY